MPVSDSSKFRRIHVNETLTNDHSQVFHSRSIEGTLGNFERKTMFFEMRQDTTSSVMM